MEVKWLHFWAMAVLLLVWQERTTIFVRSASSNSLLGVSLEDLKYYTTSSEYIKCKDGSKKIHVAQVNDDFCDCPDGSDEPGTSACPNGRFYCQNAGHVPVLLFSSRVNDGICDCCDGSDEYNGMVKCPNTCWEAGKVARDKLKKKIATYKDGAALRKREIEQAKLEYAKDKAELLKLQNEEKVLVGLVQELKEKKEQIDKAEEKERLEKENDEKMRKEAEEKVDQDSGEDVVEAQTVRGEAVHSTEDNVVGNVEDASDQGVKEAYDDSEDEHSDSSKMEESPTKSVEQLEKELAANTEGLSKEELGRLVASRWTGESTEQKTQKASSLKDGEGLEEIPKDVHKEEEYDGYVSELEDDDGDDHKYDDQHSGDHMDEDLDEDDGHDDSTSSYKSDYEDDSFLSDLSNPSWLEKIKRTVRHIVQSVNPFQTPVDKSDAARIRKEYDESSAKLSKIKSRISSLSGKLKHDSGPEKEFYLFHGRCFEGKQSKYTYKVCPFKQASQVEGHSTTQLGHWEKFDDSYKVMLFTNGDKCWNGPDRSLKVKLRCGLTNEITDVDEPSRCEYIAQFSTPNVCYEEKLKELQQKLEKMNAEQPQNHDEL